MRGCDPTTSLHWKIENQTSSEIEVMLYGLSRQYGDEKKDSLRILEQDEKFIVFYEEQMGTSPDPTRIDNIYFIDSIRVTHLDKNVVSARDYMDIDEWKFIKEQQMLIIQEEDFE